MTPALRASVLGGLTERTNVMIYCSPSIVILHTVISGVTTTKSEKLNHPDRFHEGVEIVDSP